MGESAYREGDEEGIYPARVRKLQISTNICGEKLQHLIHNAECIIGAPTDFTDNTDFSHTDDMFSHTDLTDLTDSSFASAGGLSEDERETLSVKSVRSVGE